MKRNLLNNICIWLCLLCMVLQSRAQSAFLYKSGLDSVTRSGFYRVNLLPALVAKLQPDLSDVRILDPTGKQVPYILQADPPVFEENKFIDLPIVSNKKEADKQTHVVIENTGARSLHELLLVIKNTEANRLITLSGSDDNKQWYVIKENIYLSNLFTTPDERLIQSISFPNSNYKYFKITIIGKDILPVNIIRAGVYEAIVGPVQYRLLPSPVLTQKDSSDKCSYVLLQFDDAYMMNRIEIHTAGATFYKRKIEVSPEKNTYHIPSENFSISSDAQPVFALEDKTSRLLLKIYNNDNPPLQITGVNVFQRNICLLTFLEKDKSYHLLFDDSLARPPSYDLSFFKDSIHGNIDSINYEKAASNQSAINKEPVAGTSNRWWIWLAVAGACFVLLLLTIRLTKEINKRNA